MARRRGPGAGPRGGPKGVLKGPEAPGGKVGEIILTYDVYTMYVHSLNTYTNYCDGLHAF